MEQRQEKPLIKEQEQTKKQPSNEKKMLAVMILIAALTTAIFVAHAILDSVMNYQSWRAPMICYFTLQSNIIIALWFALIGTNMYIGKYGKLSMSVNLSAVVTTYILVTCIIYWTVLVPMYGFSGDGAWMFSSSNIWLHTTSPFIAFMLHRYMKSRQRDEKPKLHILYFYLYPILYIIMALYYAAKGTYIYPMFNPTILGGWAGVAACLLVMIVVFTVLYAALLRGGKKKAEVERAKPFRVEL